MRQLVEQIARTLVDYPDDVKVTETQEIDTIVLELRTHPDDTGRVIGRNGRTVRAIRTLLAAGGSKLGKRFTLNVLSEESSQPPRAPAPHPRQSGSKQFAGKSY